MIDAAGMIVMPGLVDLHFHTAIGKGYSDTCRCGSTSTSAGTR